jgi:hypothetical protein
MRSVTDQIWKIGREQSSVRGERDNFCVSGLCVFWLCGYMVQSQLLTVSN